MEFSLIIPVYNETDRLPQTLNEIRLWLDQRFKEYEIIVVDDNSPDCTADYVDNLSKKWPNIKCLRQNKRLGKGASVTRGCLAAVGEYVLFMDADHSVPIHEYDKFLPHFQKNYDVVVGARIPQEDFSKIRRLVSLLQQILAHMIVFKKSVIDSQCGYKCFTNKAAKKIFSKSKISHGMIDVEVFYLAHKYGLKVYYHAVPFVDKPGSKINILKCMIIDPIDLFKIRLFNILKYYK